MCAVIWVFTPAFDSRHLKGELQMMLINPDLIEAAVRSFFGVENYPKHIFEKIHNQPVFKTICLP